MLFGMWMAGIAAGTVAAGLLAWRRAAGWMTAERWALALAPAAGGVLLAAAAAAALYAPFYEINGLRLTQAVAFAKGYALYYGPSDGPLTSVAVYGPIMALWYAPAAWAGEPGRALALAAALSCLALLVPPAVLVGARLRGHPRRGLYSFLLLALTLAALLFSEPLRTVAFFVMADGPSLGLAAGAAVALYLARGRPGPGRLAAAAVCMALALWTKQTVLPVAVGLGLYLLATAGWRPALGFGLLLAAAGVAVLLLVLLVQDYGPMAFNILGIEGSARWRAAGFARKLAANSFVLLREAVPLALALAAALVAWNPPAGGGAWRREEGRWLLWLVLAAACFPMSVLAYSKRGGDVNHFALTLYFVLLAAVALLAEGIRAAERPAAARGLALLLAFFLGLHLTAPRTVGLLAAKWADNPETTAWRYLRAHPGRMYFPRQPLAALFAEGRLYHVADNSIWLREVMGHPVTEAHFKAYIPPRMEYYAMRAPEKDFLMRAYLKEFRRECSLPELPGWTVYAREPAAPAAPGPQGGEPRSVEP